MPKSADLTCTPDTQSNPLTSDSAMKRKLNPLLLLYQYVVAVPLWTVTTVVAALLTMLLSPVWPNRKISYFPARWWSRIVCALFFVTVKVEGMDNLNRRQSYIFMVNHQSWFDIFAIYGWLPFFFKWIMKEDLRRIPLVGRACESAGHIFINRESPKAAQRSLEKAKNALRGGVSVVIFPEGTRSPDGRLGRFKRGGFKLSADLGLPIVPVSLKGCYERMPRGTFAVKPGRIVMKVHPPILLSSPSPDHLPALMHATRESILRGLSPDREAPQEASA